MIKSKQEAEIFNDLPLFDVNILKNFIDEWFDNQDLSFDDLQLPIGISVSFHGAIAHELALAQKIVELKHKIDCEKARFKKHMAKLSVADVQSFKTMLHELKDLFHKKHEEAKGSREQMKYFAEKCVQAHNEAEKRKALGRPGIDPKMVAKLKRKPMKISGHELTPAVVLRNEDETIDLSSNEGFGDDALELLIKSKQEAEIFNDLPLFDVDILNNFMDEWFDDPSLSIDDLQLPVDIGVTFHGAITNEFALAQKIVEMKNKIDFEKAQFKKHMAKLSVADVQSFKQMLHNLNEQFHKKREEAKGSRERMKYFAEKCVQAHNEAEKREALGRPGIDPRMAAKKKKKPATAEPDAPRQEAVPM